MRNLHLFWASTCLLAGALFTTACGSRDPQPDSLYVRLGGKTGIEGIADQMVANVAAETGLPNSVMLRSHKPMLDANNGVNGEAPTDPTRVQRLRNNVVDQFTNISGGPLPYTGKSMLAAHVGMQITSAEYMAWRGLLADALTKKNVGSQDKADFLTLIDAMKADVINH
jgi:hemoglobin